MQVKKNTELEHLIRTRLREKNVLLRYSDSLPNVAVSPNDGEQLYCWVKLPANDKRSLTMGYFADRCQSMGDHSQQCVKDAGSRGNNEEKIPGLAIFG